MKVFFPALQQQTDKMVEGCGKKLKRVEEIYVAYLKLEKPLSILRYDADIIKSNLFIFLLLFSVFFSQNA